MKVKITIKIIEDLEKLGFKIGDVIEVSKPEDKYSTSLVGGRPDDRK